VPGANLLFLLLPEFGVLYESVYQMGFDTCQNYLLLFYGAKSNLSRKAKIIFVFKQ
jgi:hypothetical protein